MFKLMAKNLITYLMPLAGLILLFTVATSPVILAQAESADLGQPRAGESGGTALPSQAGLAHSPGKVVDTTTANQVGGVYTVVVQVAAGSDDAEERVDGSVSLASSDLELVFDGAGDQTVGMRFNGVTIPPGATISKAYVQFQVDETHAGSTSLTIQGEDVDHALTFTSTSGNISSRPRTSAAVPWSPNPWSTVGEAGPDQQTPDIASIIQEIVNRSGWSSDNSLVIIITGTGERAAGSYNGDPTGAPMLHVEYTPGPPNAPPGVTISAPANKATFNDGDTITFTGTAIDAEDGDVTASLAWESNLEGPIGTGGSFSRSGLSVGGHTITATVTDRGGLTAFDNVTINIVSSTTVLVGAGDIARCGSEKDLETALLLDNIAGTVFTLGDNVYPDGTDLEFSDCYDPTWGRYKARTRPAAGNHDYHTPGASGYFNYFGAAAGEVGRGYYSYDVGAWHIIVLNSQCAEVGGCDSGSVQWQWLQADLAANPTACTLAYWHHPRFSSGSKHGSNARYQDFWQLLYNAGADVVLNGHDHSYERFAPQDPTGTADPGRGIREFVVGTGGAGLYTFDTPEPNSEVRESNTHGVLKLTLHPTSYDWEFIPIAGQTFTDSGSASCVMLNGLPVANDDTAMVAEDSSLNIAVLTNDDFGGDGPSRGTITILTQSTNGTATVNAGVTPNDPTDDTIDYTPDANYSGPDSLMYEICDSNSDCDLASVSITVNPVTDPPTAIDDSASTTQGTALTIDVAANDSDPDDNLDPASANTSCAACAEPANGTLVNNGDGTFGYTPNPGFNGSDNFVYEICDTGPLCDTAAVSISVAAIPALQVQVAAGSDDAEERVDGSVSLASSDLELVFDGAGDQTVGMRFNGVTIPPGATISKAYVQFQADETHAGSTSLTIQGEDVDHALTFTSASGNISSRPRTSAAVPWSPNPWATVGEAGPDQQTPDIASVIQEIVNRSGWSSDNSLVIIITGTGERAAESYNGDPTGAPLLHVEYTTAPPNAPPVANDDIASTTPDTALTIDVAANDSDPDGNLDPASANTSCAACAEPTNGTLVNNGDGTFGYTPNPGFNGSDNFVYEICDTGPLCDTAAVSISVNPAVPTGPVTFAPVADARVVQASPDTNYGTTVRLDVDSPGEESYIRFNVTGVTGAVQNATMRLFVTNGSTNGPSLYATDNSWTETGITWNNRPAPTTGAIANVGIAAPDTWVEYDITAHVTGDGTNSFVFLPDSTNGVTFSSREGSSPPELMLTFAGTP